MGDEKTTLDVSLTEDGAYVVNESTDVTYTDESIDSEIVTLQTNIDGYQTRIDYLKSIKTSGSDLKASAASAEATPASDSSSSESSDSETSSETSSSSEETPTEEPAP